MNPYRPPQRRLLLTLVFFLTSLLFTACESTPSGSSGDSGASPVAKGDKYFFEGIGHVQLKIRTRNTREELFDGYLINRMNKTLYSEEPLYVAANPMENVKISVNDTPKEISAKGLTAVVIKP